MTSLISLISSIALIIAPFFLISPSYSTNIYSYNNLQGLVVGEEKARLGSTPPSCHNKCNQCHPCSAVQVPAQPSRRNADPDSAHSDPSAGNRYSNYKPLGWKCDCDGHYYNP
ncbi:epidermal patterning factor-like protein 1 [Phtheirospermum japonicum]|uniref:Epidermal patterning factor-like protein n=1 Tax=Phtheirospermum japonicum TaxID=374723 RepID=A0A830BES2_9LAMI|nr:epidermal patterning factor-like protein 1 [Phtheirospermum japonicum]